MAEKRMFSMKGEADAKLQSERAVNDANLYGIRQSNERKLNSINLSHRKEIQALEENIESLEIGLKLYREQYERAVRLYPSLEEEINRMVVKENEERDLERARAFDVAASEFDGRSATRQMVEDLKKTLEMYTLLSPSQKSTFYQKTLALCGQMGYNDTVKSEKCGKPHETDHLST